METDVAVLAERRAKMARLRTEHFVAGREVTSAPSVTSVDEFNQIYGAAERKAKESADMADMPGQHQVFRANGKVGNGDKKSDLSFNPLIDEANQRRRTKNESVAELKGSEGVENTGYVSDDFSDESLEPYIGQSFSQTIGLENKLNDQSLKSENSLGKTLLLEKEKSSKIYKDGKYLSSNEDHHQASDQGYQTAVNSPSDSMRRSADCGDVVIKPSNQLLKLEPAIDPLSVSLPEAFLKSVKTDLSQSIKSTSSTKSRVHYDPRIFSSKKQKKEDPEKEYFDKMSRFYGEMNEKYPPTNKNPGQSQSQSKPVLNAASLTTGLKVGSDENNEGLECIDLEDTDTLSRSAAMDSLTDTISIKTEFEDPDRQGRSRRRDSLDGGRGGVVGEVMGSITNIGQGILNNTGVLRTRKKGHGGSPDSDDLQGSWAQRSSGPGPASPASEPECRVCKHQRGGGAGCWTVIGLLFIDLLTLALLIGGYNKLKQFHEEYEMLPPIAGRNGGYLPRDQDIPSSFQGRSLDIPFNETAEEEKKTIQGRSLDVQPNGDVFQAESSSPLVLRRVTPPNDVLLYNFLTVNVSQERNSDLSNLIIYPTLSSSAKTLPSSSSTKSSDATQNRTLSPDVITEISVSRPENIPSNIDQAGLSSPAPDISLRFADGAHSDEASGSGDLVSGQLEPSVKSGESLAQENDQQGSSEVKSASISTVSVSTTVDSISSTSTATTATTSTTTIKTTTTSYPVTTTTTSTIPTTKPVSIEELQILQKEMVNVREAFGNMKKSFDQEIADLKSQLNGIKSPPSFSCFRTEPHLAEDKIEYSGCSVKTKGMDPSKGTFTVEEAGVYQLTFTGFITSRAGHMVSADIYHRRGKEDKIIGRASAKTVEDGILGKDDDLHSTISIVVQEELQRGDQVLVSMVIHGNHGSSKLDSDWSRKIIFTGLKISN